MSNKKYWRLALIVMIVGLMAFGAGFVALADSTVSRPTDCPKPAPDKGNTLPGDWFGPDGGFEDIGAGDIRPDKLPYPDHCVQTGYLKLNMDEKSLTTGSYNINDGKGTNDGFNVYIWNDGNTFAFSSNYHVYHVYVKGGPDGGNLYSYLPNGTRKDCGLSQGHGSGWSHVTFYYCVPQYGSLEVNKEFVFDHVEDYTFDIDEITIKIVGPSYNPNPGETFTIDIEPDGTGSRTFDNLVPGTYTVTEESLGAEWNVVITGDGVVNANSTAVVDIISTLVIEEQGYLKVIKTFEDLPDDYTLPTVSVTVSGPDDYEETKDLELVDGVWQALFGPMEPGDYTVTENVDKDVWDVEITYPNPELDYAVVVDGEETDAVVVDITNTYIPEEEDEEGYLKVVKTFEDVPDDYTLPTISVTISGPDNYQDTKDLVLVDGVWQALFGPLETGNYTVTENVDKDVWDVEITYPNPELDYAVVVDGGETDAVVVDITNTFIPEDTGSVTINKVVVDDDGDVIDDDETFTVTLTGPNGYSNTFNITAGQTVSINGLALGPYSVTEADKNGYELVSITPDNFELDVDNLNISVTIINEMLFEDVTVDPEEPGVDPEDPKDSEKIIDPEKPKTDPLPQTNGTQLPLMGLGILLTAGGLLLKRKKQ